VVRTPQSLDGGAGDGAAGVSMNSKSSEDSECVLAMVEEANWATVSTQQESRLRLTRCRSRAARRRGGGERLSVVGALGSWSWA